MQILYFFFFRHAASIMWVLSKKGKGQIRQDLSFFKKEI